MTNYCLAIAASSLNASAFSKRDSLTYLAFATITVKEINLNKTPIVCLKLVAISRSGKSYSARSSDAFHVRHLPKDSRSFNRRCRLHLQNLRHRRPSTHLDRLQP